MSTTNSSIKTRSDVESLHRIDIIGRTSHQITGAKLPSLRQVLSVMFHNMRFVKLSARESAKLAINLAAIFWHQARIPIRAEARCIDKLEKEYDKWKNIQRTKPDKRSETKKKVAQEFGDRLDDLFDIAAGDALETIRIEEDKAFLLSQREKGRPGCMIGVDMTLYGRERRAQERREKEEARKRKHEEMSREQCNIFFEQFIQ